jgi:preprotein translocase subunit SecG
MDILFLTLTIVFIVASVAMVLIILVQRPQGGGLAGAFGGAGGGGTEGVFGGRVGDALTVMTVVGFCIYLTLASVLNANIWVPSSTAVADETTANEILFPTAVGEPGFDDEPEPSASQPLDTGFAPPVGGEPVDVEFTPEGEVVETPATQDPDGDGN